MAVSQGKHMEMETRKELEMTLFNIGCTIQDVATALDLPRDRVEYDLRSESHKRTMTAPQGSRSQEDRDRTFGKALSLFWKIRIEKENAYSALDKMLMEALKRYINYPKLRAVATGVIAGIGYLCAPREDSVRFRAYQNLLRVVAGRGPLWEEILANQMEEAGRILLEDYIIHLYVAARDGLGEIPGRDSFAAAFAAWAIDRDKKEFRIALTEESIAILEDAITRLPTIEAQVIRLRFGLWLGEPVVKGGEKGLTLEQVGNFFGVTRERIRQREAEALRTLRRSPRVRFLARSNAEVTSWALRRVRTASLSEVGDKGE